MSIVNKRNAVLGWGVWRLTKRIAKRKAKSAVPGTPSRGPAKAKLGALIAAAGAAAFFWRRRRTAA